MRRSIFVSRAQGWKPNEDVYAQKLKRLSEKIPVDSMPKQVNIYSYIQPWTPLGLPLEVNLLATLEVPGLYNLWNEYRVSWSKQTNRETGLVRAHTWFSGTSWGWTTIILAVAPAALSLTPRSVSDSPKSGYIPRSTSLKYLVLNQGKTNVACDRR